MQDLKVIPIAGGPKCSTRKLSELIDASSKPFLKHTKRCIRDSVEFLDKCDRNTDGNAAIATFDVVGLYTNIQHTFGLKALTYFLSIYEEDIYPWFNITFILESIDFIFKKTLVYLTMNTVYSSRGTMNANLTILLNQITTLTSGNISWRTGKDF